MSRRIFNNSYNPIMPISRWDKIGLRAIPIKTMRVRFPVAAHIFLLKDNAVLLLRRANTGYEDGNYGVVAGHVELGESVTQAAVREIWEEVGVIVRLPDLQPVGV